MSEPICPGCGGKGQIEVRVQRLIKGKRLCVVQDETCFICQGSGHATQEEADAWFAREFPGCERL